MLLFCCRSSSLSLGPKFGSNTQKQHRHQTQTVSNSILIPMSHTLFVPHPTPSIHLPWRQKGKVPGCQVIKPVPTKPPSALFIAVHWAWGQSPGRQGAERIHSGKPGADSSWTQPFSVCQYIPGFTSQACINVLVSYWRTECWDLFSTEWDIVVLPLPVCTTSTCSGFTKSKLNSYYRLQMSSCSYCSSV